MKTTTPAPPSATRLTSVIAAVSARAEHIKPARPWLSDAGAYSDAACELLAEMTADRDRLAAEVADARLEAEWWRDECGLDRGDRPFAWETRGGADS